jgi:hypothetical protein
VSGFKFDPTQSINGQYVAHSVNFKLAVEAIKIAVVTAGFAFFNCE